MSSVVARARLLTHLQSTESCSSCACARETGQTRAPTQWRATRRSAWQRRTAHDRQCDTRRPLCSLRNKTKQGSKNATAVQFQAVVAKQRLFRRFLQRLKCLFFFFGPLGLVQRRSCNNRLGSSTAWKKNTCEPKKKNVVRSSYSSSAGTASTGDVSSSSSSTSSSRLSSAAVPRVFTHSLPNDNTKLVS